MRYQAVVFDLDGTLLDTIEDLTDAVNMTMRHYGWPEHTIAQVKTYVGNGVGWLVECAVPGGKTNPLFEEALEIQKQNYAQVCENKTRPYDGIIEVIRELKNCGYKVSIVSNKGQEAVEALRKLYFSDVIEVAIGERDGIRRKPAPDTAFEAVKKDKAYLFADTKVPKVISSTPGANPQADAPKTQANEALRSLFGHNA
jgi:phosphoglycolate phosphatase